MGKRDIHDEEHVVRCCSRQKQVVDENGTVLGVTWEAFALRDVDKGYLSVALFETVSGDADTRLIHIRGQWDQSGFRYNPRKAVMAVCNTGIIREYGLKRACKIRVLHEPSRQNDAYSAIRRLPQDNGDIDLLESLASEAAVSIHPIASLP